MTALSDADRKRRFRELWKTLVPPSGEAESWQGEVIRIIGNAEDEAHRNGFVNWCDEDDRDLDLFVDRLSEGRIFDAVAKGRLRVIAEKIKQAGHDTERPEPSEEEWDFMFFRAVDWCEAHPEPIPLNDKGDYVGHF